ILDPTADKEDAESYRAMVRAQFTDIVNQLGTVGGPPLQRVDLLFRQLLGPKFAPGTPIGGFPLDPDQIPGLNGKRGGTLGTLRDAFGLQLPIKGNPNPFVNSVDDEANVTNYRTCADHMLGVFLRYFTNRSYFNRSGEAPNQFLGHQPVLLHRQLVVV